MQNGKTIKTWKNVEFNVDIFKIQKIWKKLLTFGAGSDIIILAPLIRRRKKPEKPRKSKGFSLESHGLERPLWEPEMLTHLPGWQEDLMKMRKRKWKKWLTNSKAYDKINELLLRNEETTASRKSQKRTLRIEDWIIHRPWKFLKNKA